MIEPIKVAFGSIFIFASDVKSKSTLVIPNWQISGSPHKGAISTILFNVLICGSSDRFVDDLNLFPSTWSSVAAPACIKSCGPNEKQPISERSQSIKTVWAPSGTPKII